jgi:hypothetical protein
VAVEVEDVVIAGLLPQVLPEPVEGRRPQNVDGGGEALFLDQLHQGAVLYVALIRAGGDEEDIDPVPGQIAGDVHRVANPVEPALDPARVGEEAGLGVVEGLPGPGEHSRIVA